MCDHSGDFRELSVDDVNYVCNKAMDVSVAYLPACLHFYYL